MLLSWRNLIKPRFHGHEDGQTLVEYALIIALMSIAIVGALQALGGGTNGLYGVINTVVGALSGGSS
jgi:Flp pilus assembly pilin Flp